MISEKSTKIFKIKFDDSIDVLADLYSEIDPVDHFMSTMIRTEGCFDFQEDDGSYISYMIISNEGVTSYLDIMKRNGIGIKVEDVSDKILKNKLYLKEELLPHAKDINVDPYHDFVRSLDKWIKIRLSPDDVLDIINECGVDSLKDIHKEILKGV